MSDKCLEDVWEAGGWSSRVCGRPVKARMSGAALHVSIPVCGVHARSLKRRGYVEVRLTPDRKDEG